jgi:hypothetical protein
VWSLRQLQSHLGPGPWATLWAACCDSAAKAVAAAVPHCNQAAQELGLPPDSCFELLGESGDHMQHALYVCHVVDRMVLEPVCSKAGTSSAACTAHLLTCSSSYVLARVYTWSHALHAVLCCRTGFLSGPGPPPLAAGGERHTLPGLGPPRPCLCRPHGPTQE